MSEPFILVLRPHQRPAWAEAFDSEEDFISAWANGSYDRSCSCNCNLDEEDQELTYDNAFKDVSHDLSRLTRLDSAEETLRYTNERDYLGHHNKGITSVMQEAKRIGWVDE